MIVRFFFFVQLLTSICLANTLHAQHPFYYAINDDNGLPSNEVYSLQQDSFGYMWIGCDAGLYRYDGFEFKAYKNKQQNGTAISGLHYSQNKALYCQNFHGQIYKVNNDTLSILADLKDKILAHPEFTTDNKNNTLVGLPDGILQLSDNKKEVLLKSITNVSEIEIADNGYIYIINNKNELYFAAPDSGRNNFTYVANSGTVLKGSNIISCLNKNRFILLCKKTRSDSIIICTVENGKFTKIKNIPGDTFRQKINKIKIIDGHIWLATTGGAYQVNEELNIVNHYFPKEKISDIIVDKEGTYWFTTLQNGIFLIPHLELRLINNTNPALTDNNITAINKKTNGEVLFGTYSGNIFSLNPLSNAITQLPETKNAAYKNVTTIIPVNEHTIIAGRGGISVINTIKNTDKYHTTIYARDMAIVGDSIIFATNLGINVVNKVSSLIADNIFKQHNLLATSGKKVCHETANSTVWVTTNTGLAYQSDTGFRLFLYNNNPLYCNALYADEKGLWVGTVSDGVYNINHGKVTQHLNVDNGLIGSNIKCITSHNGILYAATDKCVNIMYPNGEFTYIKQANGINAKEINAISIINDKIYLATIRGLFYMPVSLSFTNIVPPKIRISSFTANDKQYPIDKNIGLPYDNNDILITFSGIALRSRTAMKYYYRIIGNVEKWQELPGSINYVRLNNLPPGTYEFQLRAANEDGILSDKTATLKIIVATPLWQKWWFILLLIIIVSTTVGIIFIVRIRNIKKKAEILNKITESQLTALKAQMNPHFMYNTLNSIQDLVLQKDIKNTNYYLSRYSTLMRKILEISEQNQVDLNEEIEILKLYLELEQLRFGADFEFSIVCDLNINQNTIFIPSMIIQPFVENAIKHGLLHKKGSKSLVVRFENHAEAIICTIKDNGVGRQKAAEIKSRSPIAHKSFATNATQKRLELINLNRKNKITLNFTDLYIDNIATGTEVKIIIPYYLNQS